MPKNSLDGDEDSGGAVSAVGSAADVLEEAAAFLPALTSTAQKLRDLEYHLQDCLAEVRDASETLEYDPARLEQVEDRLDQLYRLSLKYGPTEEEMLAFWKTARQSCTPLSFPMKRRRSWLGNMRSANRKPSGWPKSFPLAGEKRQGRW